MYVEASSAAAKAGYITYFAQYCTVVENMEEADVMVGDFSSINDACELFLDDADYYGKPVVLSLNGTKATQFALENADAVLYLSYNQSADHGSTEAGFVNTTAAWVYADLIFGIVEPGGVITKEIARDSIKDELQWKDLAGDQGADPYVRLIVQALMEDDPNHASPNNYGDPLVQAFYGMAYGEQPVWKYSCLILPQTVTQEEVEGSSGSVSIQSTVTNAAAAGEPFTVYCLLRNNGSDGIVNVEVKANDQLVATKLMTVCGGSWRVFQIDLTLEAGEYTIQIGDQTGTITVK